MALPATGCHDVEPAVFWWSLPLTLGYLVAMPFAVVTAAPAVGRLFKSLGLCGIPEDCDPPKEVVAVLGEGKAVYPTSRGETICGMGLRMTTITLEKAQQDLPALIERALAGEDIVIATNDRKVRLAAVAPPPEFDEATARRRGYGLLKGQFEVTDAFFDPLPDEELNAWEGRATK